MTNYQCGTCGKYFIHPAIATDYNSVTSNGIPDSNFKIPSSTLEVHVCPFCRSKEYIEVAEPEPEVENVYIYDLTSGPQTELDGLLAQGYVIKNRYAKSYALEKPKKAEVQK